ncbi:MAG: radical SAM protein [Candidatus Korobacteraceae bacterium]
MQIIEIYKSLQGESSFTGLPCVFVRLAGCNLRCRWCDSEYTFKGGENMSPEQVADEVRRLLPASGLVEITGGEPLLQERELVPLMKQLIESGYTLLLETSGERPLASVPPAVFKIVDVKCPDSGEGDSFRLANLDCIGSRDEVKFVIATRADYEFARDFTTRHRLAIKVANVIFSPAFDKLAKGSRDVSHCLLDPRELAGWILEDGLPVRLGLQIHKLIWDPALKGV